MKQKREIPSVEFLGSLRSSATAERNDGLDPGSRRGIVLRTAGAELIGQSMAYRAPAFVPGCLHGTVARYGA
jgi:hypothetical protein